MITSATQGSASRTCPSRISRAHLWESLFRDLIFCGEWVCTNEHHGKEARNGYPAYGLYQRRPLEGGGVNSAEFGECREIQQVCMPASQIAQGVQPLVRINDLVWLH